MPAIANSQMDRANGASRTSIGSILGKGVIAFVLAAAMAIALAGCGELEYPGRPSASIEDYVGIWACYQTHTNDHDANEESTTNHELGTGTNQFIVLRDDMTGVWIVNSDGHQMQRIDGQWYRTYRDKEAGTDSGIVFSTDDFENPLTYYESDEEDMQPHFVSERLVRGNLAIEYGEEEHQNYILFETHEDVGYHRTDYFEKVSNDPDDSSWLSAGTAADVEPTQATQFSCEASGVTYAIPAGWSQEDGPNADDDEKALASYMLFRSNAMPDSAMAYSALEYSEEGFQRLISSYEADEDTSVEQVELGGNSYWKVTETYGDQNDYENVEFMCLKGSTMHVFAFMTSDSDSSNAEADRSDFEALVASATYA